MAGVNNFVPANGAELSKANQKRVRPADLNDAKVMDSDRFVPIFEVQSNRTEVYAPGSGPSNRQHAKGWSDLDLRDDAAAPGGEINGDLRWEMYGDSSREDLRRVSDTFRTEDLRSAEAEQRTEKEVIPQLAPAAPQDGYVVLALKVDAADDGAALDSTNSTVDLGIPYSKLR